MAMSGNDTLSKDDLKRAVCEAIDRHGNEIIALGEEILHHPETGFNERKTARLVAERMAALGLEPQTGLALTGVKGRLKGAAPGPRLAVIGELDSLRTSDHPLADPHIGRRPQLRPQRPDRRHARRRDGPRRRCRRRTCWRARSCSSRCRPRSSSMSRSASAASRRARSSFCSASPSSSPRGHFDDIDMAMMIHVGSHDQMTEALVHRRFVERGAGQDDPLPRPRQPRRRRAAARHQRAVGGADRPQRDPLPARDASMTTTRSASTRSSPRAATRSASCRPR